MKKYVLLFFGSLALFSCEEKNKKAKSDQIEPTSYELSDQSFKQVFSSLPGEQLDNRKSIKYNSILGQLGSMVAQLGTKPLSDCPPLPTAINMLNSGSQYEYYKFTKETSVEAGLMGFGGTIDKKEMLLIQDYVRFQNITCTSGTKRIGIGLRCFIHVKGIKTSFKGSYADIAANAQLNNMTANFSLKSLGFAMDGNLIADGLAGQSDYNVDNFGKLAITFTNVLKTLNNDNTVIKISPVELPNNN